MCLTEYNEEETMQLFKEEGREEAVLQDICNLMKNLKFTAKQAMDVLGTGLVVHFSIYRP